MIEMDKSEFSYSDFDDEGLRMVAGLLGPECKDKLLISPQLRKELSNERSLNRSSH